MVALKPTRCFLPPAIFESENMQVYLSKVNKKKKNMNSGQQERGGGKAVVLGHGTWLLLLPVTLLSHTHDGDLVYEKKHTRRKDLISQVYLTQIKYFFRKLCEIYNSTTYAVEMLPAVL